ncbi:hypothetical protein ACFZCK_22730 [Kitasatospora purpeofusca]|uniref:hypothetical protein n=1 Tax=Kitasatospora purpeofusca TaxID=67352 RepID=UPI0036EDAEEF
MEPTSIGLTTARTGVGVVRAVTNRRRPYGVVRLGSPEDRAYAYRRFLEASVQVEFTFVQYRFGPENETLAAALHDKYVDACAELKCASFDLRLCAPFQMGLYAEKVLRTAPDAHGLGRLGADDFKEAQHLLVGAQEAFLEAARVDLAYIPRWWNVWGRFWSWRQRRVPHGMVPIRSSVTSLVDHALTQKAAVQADPEHGH